MKTGRRGARFVAFWGDMITGWPLRRAACRWHPGDLPGQRRRRGGYDPGSLCAVEVMAGLPVREFRWYKGRRHYSGWYWSATGRRLVAYESRLELARIMLADFDPAVTAVAAQPFRLTGRDGSRVRRHVPDVLLAGADGGVTVVDVKAPGKRADPEVRAVMEWTRQVAALRGWAFEEWYGAPPRLLENVCFLAGYRAARR